MIRRYRSGDALKVLVQEAQREEFEDAVLGFDEVGAYSLVEDKTGEVLAVFGYSVDEEKVADCYALVSQHAGRCLFVAVKFLRAEMGRLIEDLELVQLKMTVRAGFAAGARFARLLGFHFSEELPRFYKGYDYQLFERIEEKC